VTDPSAAGKRRPGYWFLARRRYFLNNHGPVRTVLADLAWFCGCVTYRLRRRVQRKPDNDPKWFLWDFFRYNFLLARR
jgi:N-acetylglucosaminyl-diphospho-decaprenol L-rhamnosyltransferase